MNALISPRATPLEVQLHVPSRAGIIPRPPVLIAYCSNQELECRRPGNEVSPPISFTVQDITVYWSTYSKRQQGNRAGS